MIKDVKNIRDGEGIHMTLGFGENVKHNVIAIPVIQFIISDCKGNNIPCGRKGEHSLLMNSICRDCDIIPSDGDNTCIGRELIYYFHEKADIIFLELSPLAALIKASIHQV